MTIEENVGKEFIFSETKKIVLCRAFLQLNGRANLPRLISDHAVLEENASIESES